MGKLCHLGWIPLLGLWACNAKVGGDTSTGDAGAQSSGGGHADGDARGLERGVLPDGSDDGSTGLDVAPDVVIPPEILPVVLITVDDTTVETLGETKINGLIRMVVDHDGTLRDLPNRPIALESWAGISWRGS